MNRIVALAPLAITIACSGDALETMDHQMAKAAIDGDRVAAHATLCAFVGLDADCVSDDGPVPPPPPEASDAGVFWATYMPIDSDIDTRYALRGTFQTEDGSEMGALTGILVQSDEDEPGIVLGHSDHADPAWQGVLSGGWVVDELVETNGIVYGGWAKANYSALAELTGIYRGETDRDGGRIVGSFDFSPGEEDKEPDTIEGPLDEL